MIAIWKAQDIETVLREACQKDIVAAGGSAGSLCWFQGGYSDCRPVALSIVKGLGFLPFTPDELIQQPTHRAIKAYI